LFRGKNFDAPVRGTVEEVANFAIRINLEVLSTDYGNISNGSTCQQKYNVTQVGVSEFSKFGLLVNG
jgi:hypothetical protein